MERFIFYPGFEAKDQNWLKFALLYIERLEPIIPPAGEANLSDLFLKLYNETNLIEIHHPDYDEGNFATLDAIDCIEEILRRFSGRRQINNRIKTIEYWRTVKAHDFLLYEDKYTYEWKQFCLENGFASQSEKGLLVPSYIGRLYMSLLSQIIADKKGISAITDDRNMDRATISSRRARPQNREKIRLAKAIIDLKLPSHLPSIPIEDIINIRKQNDFPQKLEGFQKELNNFLTSVENGATAQNFIDSLEKIQSEIIGVFIRRGFEISTRVLSAWIALNPANSSPDGIDYILATMSGFSVGLNTVYEINNVWNHTKTKRFARKYLSTLEAAQSLQQNNQVIKSTSLKSSRLSR